MDTLALALTAPFFAAMAFFAGAAVLAGAAFFTEAVAVTFLAEGALLVVAMIDCPSKSWLM
jgi:sulfur relay (sulfurtransferase) DsrF/TusC family protein